MKHYNSPVITFVYRGHMDVICASDQGFVEGASEKDTEVSWGGNW